MAVGMTEDVSRGDPRRPERRAYGALGAQLFLVATGLACLYSAKASTFVPPVLAALTGFVLGLFSLVRVRLARRQVEEALAVADFRASRGGGELFQDSADEALKAVGRANRVYVRYVLPVLTLLVAAGLGLAGHALWRRWTAMAVPPVPLLPLRHAVFAFSLFIAAMLAGSYFSGVSREPGCRYLRPVGGWLLFTGVLFAVAGVSLLCRNWDVGGTLLDRRLAVAGAWALLVLAVELALNVIVEFYRPRHPREQERPAYESRLLSLVTEPGGVARNLAAALDYQFGFRVSDVWLYRFLERTVIPFAVLALGVFWLMTCLVVIKAEENGLRVRFGQVTARTPLGPGLYAKLPWPFERMYTFPVERVQVIPIGYVPGGDDDAPAMPDPAMESMMGDLSGRVMVWSKFHHKDETNFVVASVPPQAGAAAVPSPAPDLEAGRVLPVSVNFLSASIPLYFRVQDLYAYAFGHRDTRRTLEEVATREVVLYLANADFVTVLAEGRKPGGEELRARIQRAADALGLGVEVVFVGLQGLHPPVKVGKAFDDVVAAMEKQHEEVLRAEKEAITTLAGAETQAIARGSEARSYRDSRVQVSAAEAARFEKQLVAYAAAPQLYTLYTFLDMLESEGQGARKYVVALDRSQEVFVINLEKKLRQDLLDLDLGQEPK